MRRALNLLAARQQKQPAPSQRIESKRPARDRSDYFASPTAAMMVAASLFQDQRRHEPLVRPSQVNAQVAARRMDRGHVNMACDPDPWRPRASQDPAPDFARLLARTACAGGQQRATGLASPRG